jgi:glycerol-3-phosphate acyltransferase PlsY
MTGMGDILKSMGAVVIAHVIGAGNAWLEAGAGTMAIVGHIYSVFLVERTNGKYVFRGGAGGAPTMGAALAMWPPSALIILPTSMGMLFGVGYASLATLSTGLVATILFAWRAQEGYGPWAYAAFGLVAEILVFWTLRPNLRRLAAGNERAVGWRAKWRARREAAQRRPEGDVGSET